MRVDPNFRFRTVFPDCPIPTLLDIGAGDTPEEQMGLGVFEKLADTGDAYVIGFDGSEDSLAITKDRVNAFRKYVNAFIADGSERTYYKTNNDLTGSLYKPDVSLVKNFNHLGSVMIVQEEIPVKTQRLDDIDEIPFFDGIKLDVQGAELDVLQGGEEKLKGADIVVCEVEFIPIYEDQPLYEEIAQYLRSQGFLLYNMRPPSQRMMWPSSPGNSPGNLGSQSVWSDAVFVRDFRRFDEFSDERLWKLALILHDALWYFDIVSRILHTLDKRNGSKTMRAYVDKLQASNDS